MNCFNQKKIYEVAGNFTMRLRMQHDAEVPSMQSSSSTATHQSDRADSPEGGPLRSNGCGGTKVPRPDAWSKPTLITTSNNNSGHFSLFSSLGRIFRCNRVDPLPLSLHSLDELLEAPVPLRPNKTVLTKAKAVPDLAAFDESNSRLGNGAPTIKRRRSVCPWISRSDQNSVSSNVVSNKSQPMLLARLLSVFTGCIGQQNSPPLEKSRGYKPPATSENEEQQISKITAPGHPSVEVGCRPCTVKPAKIAPVTSRMFWVGSGDESSGSSSEGRTMGQIVSGAREDSFQQQKTCKRRKMVANKQTSVSTADLHRTTTELQNGQHGNPQTSSDPNQDQALPYPTINEKDLRRANKESRPLVLGRGQSGVVRLMRYHRRDGSASLVAVKRLMSGSSSSTQAALKREILAMTAVEKCPIFPGVVGVISKQSFAQEFIGNLKSMATLSITKVFRGRPQISLLNWVLIIHDVIVGLSELHKSGWAHCDLQTNNVLLWRDRSKDESTTRWEGRIIDLGNAKRLEGPTSRCLNLSLTEKESYYRGCRHIPAEVVEGHVPYGVTSDIYSLGVLMGDIAAKVAVMGNIKPLACVCLSEDPQLRPSLKTFLKDLDVWCYDHTGCTISQLKSQIITYV